MITQVKTHFLQLSAFTALVLAQWGQGRGCTVLVWLLVGLHVCGVPQTKPARRAMQSEDRHRPAPSTSPLTSTSRAGGNGEASHWCGDRPGRKPIMGKLAKSKHNLLRCRELILALDINLPMEIKHPHRLCCSRSLEAGPVVLTSCSCRNCHTNFVFLVSGTAAWTGLSLMTAQPCSLFKKHTLCY